MSDLYLRKAFVTVGGVKFGGRINFEVYRGNSAAAMNKSKVSIYNLSKESRSAVDRRQGKIVINAGYGEDAPILFVGDFGIATNENPTPVFHDRKGPDVITTIEMADGDQDLAGAYAGVSLGSGSTVAQVFEYIKGTLGIPVGSVPASLKSFQFLNGFTFDGSLRKLMTDMGATIGADVSIQNGALQIVPKGTSTGEPTVLLTSATGLIGIPNKTDMGFKAKSLLNALLTPGRQVRIESKFLTAPAVFSIDRVKHVGDTHDNDWYSEIENGMGGGAV